MLQILIVEDDPMVSSINKQYLMKIIPPAKMRLYQVDRADKALALAQKLQLDLVLLDIYLPKISGTELLHLFIEHNLHPNVIMLSAAKDSQSVNQALNYGVLDYLVKPFSFERFHRAIEHFLKYNEVLNQDRQLSQTELDQVFITQDFAGEKEMTSLPKGLSNFSLNKIKAVIAETPDYFSNQEIARKSKLSRITTKKYLDYLVKTNELTIKTHYLKVGRPIKLYKANK